MRIDAQVMEALELLERERGVPVETILDALANALVSAYKRSPGAAEEARVTIDPDSGEITVYAQELDEDGNVTNEWEDTPDDFGRIAAQTAKQVIAQRLRDAKREQVFDIYEGREGDLITGIVQQVDNRFVILDLGDAEALMPGSERIPYERLDRGNRVKAFILEVRNETKGPQIVVSRSHPDLVRRLLELEVPELVDGTIEIVGIAREPGHRTKIAVVSHDPNVDAKGACVGARGSRVRQVVNELRGEKVDVVQYREDLGSFIAEALGPAKVKEVLIDEEEKTATVIVSEHQLSLAIGKEGQNARLAARLSGYKIDIRSDQPVEEVEPEPSPAEADAGSQTEPTEGEVAVSDENADDGAAPEGAAAAVDEPPGGGEEAEDPVSLAGPDADEPDPSGAEEAPAEEAPAEEAPAEEAPAEEAPAEEAPAEEAPAEETPAEETPAEETPAEEVVAEEAGSDDVGAEADVEASNEEE